MIHVKYKIWFALKLEIEDFSGDVLDTLSLVPTERCRRNLDRSRILVRQQPNMLTHLIEVNADGPDVDKPLRQPDENLAFRYQLLSKAGVWEQKSNIVALDPVHYLVYLSNNVSNKVGGTLYTNHTGTAAGTDDRLFRPFFGEVEGGALAVADVFQNNLVVPDYRLLDGTGKCREPVFTLRFSKHS